jgi:hypothetical protein
MSTGPGSKDRIDELVRLAGRPRPRPRTEAERARSMAHVAKLAAAPAALLFSLTWLKGIALASVVGGAGIGIAAAVIHLQDRDVAPPAPSSHAQAPVSPAEPPRAAAPEPAPSATVAPSVEPSVETSAAPSAPPSSARPQASARSDATRENENEMLDRAHRALASNPAETLAIVHKHAAMFPRGRLGAEREILTIEALLRLGRTREARARAESLLQRAPRSIYAERVRSMLDRMR